VCSGFSIAGMGGDHGSPAVFVTKKVNFETQFDRFANALGDLLEGSRLGMTSRELGDRRNVISFIVALCNDIELAWQRIVLSHYFTLSVLPDRWGCEPHAASLAPAHVLACRTPMAASDANDLKTPSSTLRSTRSR